MNGGRCGCSEGNCTRTTAKSRSVRRRKCLAPLHAGETREMQDYLIFEKGGNLISGRLLRKLASTNQYLSLAYSCNAFLESRSSIIQRAIGSSQVCWRRGTQARSG